jgi:hypothetical protein
MLTLLSVGPHKLARILGLCLEYRFAVGISPDSPHNSLSRTGSYGFSKPLEGFPNSQHGTSPKAEAATGAFGQSHLDVLKVTLPANPTPILVKPRSTVLLVEDNSVNMKVRAHFRSRNLEYL